MNILRSVFAILNILAAIGFVSLAALDYGKRQAWSYAVLQESFVIRGLPVNDDEKDAEGQALVKFIGPQMQQQLFAGIEDKTQEAAVKRREAKLRQDTDNAANKKQELEAILVQLARSESRREELRREIRSDKSKLEDLLGSKGPFELAFREALTGKTFEKVPGQNEEVAKDLELDQWRQAIAHVLVNTSRTPEEHQQTPLIVGLSAYAHELNAQATALSEMVAPLQAAQEDQRSAFEIEHKALLQRISTGADRIRDLEETLISQRTLLDKDKALVTARQNDVDELNKRLETARQATKRALAMQSKVETELFDTQRAVTTTDDQNQRLEREIKTRERGR